MWHRQIPGEWPTAARLARTRSSLDSDHFRPLRTLSLRAFVLTLLPILIRQRGHIALLIHKTASRHLCIYFLRFTPCLHVLQSPSPALHSWLTMNENDAGNSSSHRKRTPLFIQSDDEDEETAVQQSLTPRRSGHLPKRPRLQDRDDNGIKDARSGVRGMFKAAFAERIFLTFILSTFLVLSLDVNAGDRDTPASGGETEEAEGLSSADGRADSAPAPDSTEPDSRLLVSNQLSLSESRVFCLPSLYILLPILVVSTHGRLLRFPSYRPICMYFHIFFRFRPMYTNHLSCMAHHMRYVSG